MRDYVAANGERRLWYDDDEIERTMETELANAGLLPTGDRLEVDVDRFVERHLKARLDHYAALAEGVLGETAFSTDGTCEVRISRTLTRTVEDEDSCPPGMYGRWRATMAHEAAHVLLHRILYSEAPTQGALFGAPSRAPSRQVRRCDARDVGFGGSGGSDWREVQANKGMAALLMPRTQFGAIARGLLAGAPRAVAIGTPDHATLVASLARRFAVSKQAAGIRLQTLGLVSLSGQGDLT